MRTTIEQLLADIYALDASLKERDHEVRLLVEELVRLRPQVALDPAFVQRLRARLVAVPAPERQHAVAHDHALSWWMVRLAPLGAIALLVFMLVPQTPSPSRMDMGGGGGGSTSYRTPSSMGGGGTAPATMPPQDVYKEDAVQLYAEPAADTAERSMPGADVRMIAENGLSVSTQAPGDEVYIDLVTLMRPGYVAIFTDEGGAPRSLIGVSDILAQGTSDSVIVPLVRTMEANGAYHAMLIADNGDGRFDTSYDAPIIDPATGAPMRAQFTVVSGAAPYGHTEPAVMSDPAPPDGGGGSPGYRGAAEPEPAFDIMIIESE